MKKIAFLFLIYDIINNEELWYNFFKNIDKRKYNIYIHYKEQKELQYFEKFKIKNCIKTSYCHVSIIHAHNLLIKKALEDDIFNYKFINVSQACIPVKSFDYIYNYLIKDENSYFNIMDNNEPLRYLYILKYLDKSLIHKASNWFIINRYYAEIFASIKENYINKLYLPVYCPEEFFYITYLYCNKKSKNIIFTKNESFNATTYTNWRDIKENYYKNSGPKEYSEIYLSDLEKIIDSSCLFARKFNKDCKFIEKNTQSFDEYLNNVYNL